MYFVVFVEDIKDHLIIPVKWIRDQEKTFQKFMNYSVNSNQRHLFYYNNSEEAIKTPLEPNFDLPIAKQPSTNCCYIGKVIKFFCKFKIFQNFYRIKDFTLIAYSR